MAVDNIEIVLPLAFSKELPDLPPLPEGWPAQGEWTYDDYLRLPDDGRRFEIIEGVLYVTNAPSYAHQFAAFQIARLLGNHVLERKLGIVLGAPFEIHLSDIAKPVQPDVFFIAADRQPASDAQFFEGAPDLIVEVSSPSTARADRFIKFYAYERASMREFWIVNPQTRAIEVYARNEAGEFELHSDYVVGDSLSSAVLPEFSAPVADLFAA